MNAYLLVGLDKQQRLAPLVVISADSLEDAAKKLAGSVIEKWDPRRKGLFPPDCEFGCIEPSPKTAPLVMTAITGIGIAPGPMGEEFLSDMLTNSYPVLLLGLLPQI